MQTTVRRSLALLTLSLGALALSACSTGPSDQTTAEACAILTEARSSAVAHAEEIGATISEDPLGAGKTAVTLVYEAGVAIASISNDSIRPVADEFGAALSAAGDEISTLAQNPTSISVDSFSSVTDRLTEASAAVTKACG